MFQYMTSSESEFGGEKSSFYLGKVSHRSKTKFWDDDKYYTPPEDTDTGTNYSREQGLTYDDSVQPYDIKTRKVSDKDLCNVIECGITSPKQIWKKHNADRKGLYTAETYCCPLDEYNDQKYRHNVLANKPKLRRLVKKHVAAEERQKRKAAWNEYIQQLRIKHTKADGSPPTFLEPLQLEQSNIKGAKVALDEQNKSTFIAEPSNYCKDLLRDLYSFQNQYFTYPCSSFGRMLMLQKEQGNSFALGPSSFYSRDKKSIDFENYRKSIVVKTDINPNKRQHVNTPIKIQNNTKPYSRNSSRNIDTAQKRQIIPPISDDSSDVTKEPTPYVKRGKETYKRDNKIHRSREQKKPLFPIYNNESIDVSKDKYINRKNKYDRSSKSKHQKRPLSSIYPGDQIDASRDSKLNAKRERYINRKENLADKNKRLTSKLAPSDAYDDYSTIKKEINSTENKVNKNIEHSQESTRNDNYNDDPLREDTFNQVKEEIEVLKSGINQSPLKIIEDKLNTLIAQINSIISHNVLANIHKCPCKRKRTNQYETNETNKEGTCCRTRILENKNNDERDNNCAKETFNQFILETMANASTTRSTRSSVDLSKIREILLKELNLSDKPERDNENKDMNGEDSSNMLIIYDDESTHDRGTVVSNSFLKANLEGDQSFESRELYAVYPNNTTQQKDYDPLGLFTLLKISSATIGRMLSFMKFGYRSLLPQILSRRTTTARSPVIAFNCTICDSSFQKSAEFSEHIIRVHKAEPSK
ncbi:hypothetical protein NE865_15819 [Phthorimaea operculella]|nr:hypothetical protein NE865_15819 [Phthorimaea operculella]